jgi:hypothetical protein
LSFAEDGALATGGDDRMVLVWSLSVEAMQEQACLTVGRDLDAEEREEFLPSQPDRSLTPTPLTCAQILGDGMSTSSTVAAGPHPATPPPGP